MRTSIKPDIRADGVSFVDKEHFGNGKPIQSWTCYKCKTNFTELRDQDSTDESKAIWEVTGGFYGPNGNGYTYWCGKEDCLGGCDLNE